MNGRGIMFLSDHLCYLFIFMALIQTRGVMNFCFDSSMEGFRLNTTIFKNEVASERIDCVMECVKEPCCRSVNYKITSISENQTNCEMLHGVVENRAGEKLKINSSYDYVFLIEPLKGYNASCLPNASGKKLQDRISDSKILSNEQQVFHEHLKQWLSPLTTGIWTTCWRASRDGWSARTFHWRCDDKEPTLTIIKVIQNKKDYIFGGYATASWTASADGPYKRGPGSFLFSLRNNDDIPPFKVMVRNNLKSSAIYTHHQFGPTFGEKDLFISHNANANQDSMAELGKVYHLPSGYIFQTQNTRDLLAGGLKFTPYEVEVLYLRQ